MSFKVPPVRFRDMFPGARLVYNHLGDHAFYQFREDTAVAAEAFMQGANQGKLQHSVPLDPRHPPLYKEIFERQMYARWGVFPLQENAKSHRITFRWDLDNPLLYPRRGAIQQFFLEKIPFAKPSSSPRLESALQDMVYQMRQRALLTDRTLQTGEAVLPYHGFMMDGKMSLLSSTNATLTTPVSREAAEKVLDYAYHRYHFIPDHWPVKLIEEVHALAEAFHLNFLAHITQEALDYKKSH